MGAFQGYFGDPGDSCGSSELKGSRMVLLDPSGNCMADISIEKHPQQAAGMEHADSPTMGTDAKNRQEHSNICYNIVGSAFFRLSLVI